jgi:hypothetical protein
VRRIKLALYLGSQAFCAHDPVDQLGTAPVVGLIYNIFMYLSVPVYPVAAGMKLLNRFGYTGTAFLLLGGRSP